MPEPPLLWLAMLGLVASGLAGCVEGDWPGDCTSEECQRKQCTGKYGALPECLNLCNVFYREDDYPKREPGPYEIVVGGGCFRPTYLRIPVNTTISFVWDTNATGVVIYEPGVSWFAPDEFSLDHPGIHVDTEEGTPDTYNRHRRGTSYDTWKFTFTRVGNYHVESSLKGIASPNDGTPEYLSGMIMPYGIDVVPRTEMPKGYSATPPPDAQGHARPSWPEGWDPVKLEWTNQTDAKDVGALEAGVTVAILGVAALLWFVFHGKRPEGD